MVVHRSAPSTGAGVGAVVGAEHRRQNCECIVRILVARWTLAAIVIMKFSKLIADIGVKVAGDSETINSLDTCSSLDHVRKLAYSNNYEDLDIDYPILAMENLDPRSPLLYDHPVKELQLQANRTDLSKIDGLRLMGGCMLETKRACFAVTVLYSEKNHMVVLHSGSTDMSVLESEIYDHSCSNDGKKWESQVLDEAELNDNLARQKECAISSRTVGLKNIPKGFISDKNLSCFREGILPLLSLRCFQNEGEYGMVNAAVRRMLRVVPHVDDDDVLSTKWAQAPVSFCSFWETSVTDGKRDTAREDTVCHITNRPILSSLAYAVLQYANPAESVDSRGNINKWTCTKERSDSHTAIVLCAQKEERKNMDEFKQVKVTDLWENNNSDEFIGYSSRRHISRSTYCLKQALKNMGRTYSTVLLTDLTDMPQLKVAHSVAESIVGAVFKEGHGGDAIKYFESLPNPPFTAFSSICKLAKCLDEQQAFLVVDREEDGRLGRVVLASSADNDIENINKQSFARMACLFPWIRVFIVDKKKASLLCVKDPHDVASCHTFLPECMAVRKDLRTVTTELMQDESAQRDEAAEGNDPIADDNNVTEILKDVRKSMEELRCSNEALVAKNTVLEQSIKKLSTKLDTVSQNVSSAATSVAEQNVAKQEKPATSVETHKADAKNQHCGVSKTMEIFESVLLATESLHKRILSDISR